jgi:oligopeptide/dipeptide ABC transporter ATP-binding protein
MQNLRGKKIALIPQDPMTSLNPLYTIGDQLLEVIKTHQGLSEKDAIQKAIEALDEVRIPSAKSRLKSYPHEFSGGMKQRAIIAMALACKAEILIADEPTTALDVTIQAQIMDIMREIKTSRNTAILLITHDLALVKENADNVCVMYSGRIAETGIADLFFKNPRHPYSIALLNSLPTVRGKALETIQGQPPTINQTITGCRFHPRCKRVFKPCINNIPELRTIENGHLCACHLNQ